MCLTTAFPARGVMMMTDLPLELPNSILLCHHSHYIQLTPYSLPRIIRAQENTLNFTYTFVSPSS